jgi:hypothetical protein
VQKAGRGDVRTFSARGVSLVPLSAANSLAIFRHAAGTILGNGSTVPDLLGAPTVAKYLADPGLRRHRRRRVHLDETSGALPAAHFSGARAMTGADFFPRSRMIKIAKRSAVTG